MKAAAIAEKDMQVNTDRKKRKIVRRILLALVALVVALLVFAFVSPLPVSMALKIAFSRGNAVAPENYELIAARVTAVKDLTYPSGFKSNKADIYYPKDGNGPFPVVLWIHGGAYVGGDKKDVELFATALAAEGFAVVCMNYQLAPGAKYPAPVIQMGEAYLWLCEVATEYRLDMERFALAGDSAGAHIAAQFAAVQSNGAYAGEMKMEQLVLPGTLKSTLLFCGPFDSAKINAVDNPVLGFFLSRAAWAYFGSRSWAEQFSQQATVAGHITADFPPTFISDGNKMSFEDHARDLAETLQGSGVPVETYFLDPSVEQAYHEYQFVMNTPAGREAFQKTLDFLNKYMAA